MQKCHFELLDVLRAEIADLYRLRGEDEARLRRLEGLARRPPSPGSAASAMLVVDREPTDLH